MNTSVVAAFATKTSIPTKVLGSYQVTDVTVSGLSSGAYMATQMHIAYSETISGAAIFAGGPYYCAEGNVERALNSCMTGQPTPPNVDASISYTITNSDSHAIDDVSNLQNDVVYMFSGALDTTVTPDVMHSLEAYYLNFIPATNILTNYNINAAHTFPTLDYGNDCATCADPFISSCSFDGAGEALKYLYSDSSTMRRETAVSSNLWTFDQTPFFSGLGTSLGNEGYIYVPTTCQKGADCHLHVSFHGCEQGVSFVDTQYVEHAGFNEWAEGSGVIVLYPQVQATHEINPNGCWDWWAYTNRDYALKDGVQMAFVKKLIDELSSSSNTTIGL